MVVRNRPHVLCSQKTGIKVALRLILLFDPGRAILPSRPQISRAVVSSGSQGRRFFSAAEGLSLYGAFEVKHLFHGILHFLHPSFFV